ncbi:hypothetical protein QBC40DRAFT_293324 [Triangularia verruculosa]|uniref:Uncharacterized protein n=1 Tax=Triangularia verruculosa TaxID=2587418 RepID=A0AAN6XQT5_9PEZI|nr:hypothetical protein QBC40DRAFT_293324 [Triangularia verruculosa]
MAKASLSGTGSKFNHTSIAYEQWKRMIGSIWLHSTEMESVKTEASSLGTMHMKLHLSRSSLSSRLPWQRCHLQDMYGSIEVLPHRDIYDISMALLAKQLFRGPVPILFLQTHPKPDDPWHFHPRPHLKMGGAACPLCRATHTSSVKLSRDDGLDTSDLVAGVVTRPVVRVVRGRISLQTDVPDMAPASSVAETDARDHTRAGDLRGLWMQGFSTWCHRFGRRIHTHANKGRAVTMLSTAVGGFHDKMPNRPPPCGGSLNIRERAKVQRRRRECDRIERTLSAVRRPLQPLSSDLPTLDGNSMSGAKTTRSPINQEAYRGAKASPGSVRPGVHSHNQHQGFKFELEPTLCDRLRRTKSCVMSGASFRPSRRVATFWYRMACSTTQARDSFEARRLPVCVAVLRGLLVGWCSLFGVTEGDRLRRFDDTSRGCHPPPALKPRPAPLRSPAKRGTVRNAEQNGAQSQRQATGGWVNQLATTAAHWQDGPTPMLLLGFKTTMLKLDGQKMSFKREATTSHIDIRDAVPIRRKSRRNCEARNLKLRAAALRLTKEVFQATDSTVALDAVHKEIGYL